MSAARRELATRRGAVLTARAAASLLAIAAVVGACASPGMPPGGPVDRAAPSVVKVDPDSGATNARAKAISIRFNEVVSERPRGAQDLAGAFVLSPSDGAARVEWHRSEIVLRPRKGFRPNTAYVLTMLSGMSDLSGNAIKKDRTWVFSTGASIPQGVVRGAVFDWTTLRPAAGALIDARVGGDTTFHWIARADSSGRYVLPYLPSQAYVVRAIIDANSNGRLDVLEQWDTVTVTVADSLRTDLYAFKHDSLGPRIVGVDIKDSVTVRLTFDRPLALSPALTASQVVIRGSDSTDIPIRMLGRASVFDSLARAREQFVKDSTAKADTSAAGRLARAKADTARLNATRDSIERARVEARRAARDTVVKLPPPVPTRQAITAEYIVVLARPLSPGAYRIVTRDVLSVSQVKRTSDRAFTRNKPVEKKPDAKAEPASGAKKPTEPATAAQKPTTTGAPAAPTKPPAS